METKTILIIALGILVLTNLFTLMSFPEDKDLQEARQVATECIDRFDKLFIVSERATELAQEANDEWGKCLNQLKECQ